MRATTTLVALLFAACNGKEPDSYEGLVETTTLEAGDEDCPEGGTRIDAGADDGLPSGTAGDGELQSGEIDETVVECEELAAHAVVASSHVLGENEGSCPFGGQRVEYGHDDGDPSGTADDGILQEGEVEDHADACLDAADGLLVVTTEIPWGDGDCPTGGTRYEYGVDDGLPSGTANDGLLDDAERDGTQEICRVEVEDVFGPLAATDPGTETIDLHGGSATNAGGGGYLGVYAFGGALATAIVVRESGDLGITVPDVTATADLGASPHEVTGTQAITTWDGTGGEPTGLHIRESESEPFTLYAGSTAITGLHVASGATLTLPAISYTVLVFSADVHNEGTIVAPEYTTDTAGALELRCDDFINGDGALLDLRGDLVSGDLHLLAVGSPTSRIVNDGFIRTNSRDRPNPGIAGDAVLLARGDIVNTGNIFVRGGTSGNGSNPGADSGSLALVSSAGTIYNGGALTAFGGGGTSGGDGGVVTIASGLPVSAFGSYGWDFEPEASDGLLDPAPGGFVQDGEILTYGGAGATNGGRGEAIQVDVRGGEVHAAGSFTLSGGAGTSGEGGHAGTLQVDVTPLIAGSETWRAEEVAFEASVFATGGSGATSAGQGGGFVVQVDATMTAEGSDHLVPDGHGVVDLPGQFGQAPMIVTIAGLGAGIDVSAGSGLGGYGGSVTISEAPCYGEQPACAIPRIGARWVYNDVDIDAAGSPRGGGGWLGFEVHGEPNAVHAIVDASLVQNTGALSAPAGDDAGAQEFCQRGGDVLFVADGGDVRNTAAIDVAGGACVNGYGGYGGGAEFFGTGVSHTGDVDAGGGDGADASGGGGSFDVDGGDVVIAGDIDVSGGTVTTTGDFELRPGGEFRVAAVDLVLDGDIDASQGEATQGHEADADEGGDSIAILAATADVSGVWDASAGDQHVDDCEATDGGFITVDASVSLAADVDLSADGSSCLPPNTTTTQGRAGHGGLVRLSAPALTGTQVIRVRGGDALSPAGEAGFAGYGGSVEVGHDSAATIDCGGGAATGSVAGGGSGGDVTIAGDNSGDIACIGGGATGTAAGGGHGGFIAISGSNTGCLDVTPGAPDGGEGEIEVGGTNTGSCASRRAP